MARCLCRLLTPHLEPESAAASLRTALARLRASTARIVESDGFTLWLADGVGADVVEGESLARRMIAGTTEPAPADLSRLGMELLPGWEGDWVELERARLRQLFVHALEAHARRLAEHNAGAALAAAYDALRTDPLRESAVRILVEVHIAEGNRAEAVRVYLRFRDQLRCSLGMEPSGAMRALVAPLLANSARA